VENRTLLKKSLGEMNIAYTETQIDKLIAFQELVYNKNMKINLVGPSSKEDIMRRHILDSVGLLRHKDKSKFDNCKIIDIGTGGGFPGIPLSIFLANTKIVLLEKTIKKTGFLKKAVESLSLENIEIVNGRAEEIARENKMRGSFDLVIARAVAKISILLEYSFPFCKINGKIIFYKSRKVYEEMKLSGDAINTLGGEIEDLIKVDVSGLEEFRAFLIINKKKHTPLKYPRNFAEIKRNPL